MSLGPTRSIEKISAQAIEHALVIQEFDPIYKDWRATGSGVLIYTESLGSIVLTAEHVVLGVLDTNIRVCNLEGKSCINMDGYFLFDSDEHPVTDWAFYPLTEIPEGVTPALVSQGSQLAIGEPVTLIGVPFGQHPWVSQGHTAWLLEYPEGVLYGIDGYAAPGYSGGGIYNRQGELVAITIAIGVGTWGPQASQVLAVPIENIPIKLY